MVGDPGHVRYPVKANPGRKEDIDRRGHVHFELGPEAEIRGTAQVAIERSAGGS